MCLSGTAHREMGREVGGWTIFTKSAANLLQKKICTVIAKLETFENIIKSTP